MPRLIARLAAGHGGRRGGRRGDVAGTARRHLERYGSSARALERPHELENTEAAPGPQIDGQGNAAAQPVQRSDMTLGQVVHVKVVANARPIGGRIVRSEDAQSGQRPRRDAGHERHEIARRTSRILAQAAASLTAKSGEAIKVVHCLH